MGCVLGAPNPGWSWGLKPEAAAGPPQPSWLEGSLFVRAQIGHFQGTNLTFLPLTCSSSGIFKIQKVLCE